MKIKNKKQSIIYLNNKLKLIKKHNNKIRKDLIFLFHLFTEKIYKNINNKKYPYKFIDYNMQKILVLLILNLMFLKASTKILSIR